MVHINLISLLILFSLFACQNFSFSQEDLQKLKSTKKCPNCNLRNSSLYKLDLANANLYNANLFKANLSNKNLSKVDLGRANLSQANMVKISLIGANLTAANLSHANLRNADLSGADLTGTNLSGTDLTSSNLSGVDMRKASHLSDANLDGAIMCHTRMPDGKENNSNCWRNTVNNPLRLNPKLPTFCKHEIISLLISVLL
jgi:uncharacterized protein YjbI with pentapeptide repeats